MEPSALGRHLDRYAKQYAIAVAVIHTTILCHGIMIHGPGWDEVGHLPAGLSHWHTGRFDLYRVNPPLVRMVATAPLALTDPGIEWQWNPAYDTLRPEWDLGRTLIETHGREYFRLLRIARFSCLPFALIAIWIVWRWSSALFGPSGGLLSVLLWAFSPLVITNAQMITPDTAAAGLGAVACFTFRNWLKGKSIRLAALSGVMLGIAELTKFTWVLLFAVWPLQWAACRYLNRVGNRPDTPMRQDVKHLSLIFSTCLIVINLGYGFEGSFKNLGDYQFLSSTLGGHKVVGTNEWAHGNRFRDSIFGLIPVPLPENMMLGIDRQKVDFECGFDSYLRGVWRKRGWWYYYIYGLCVKEPVPFLILFATAIVSALRMARTTNGQFEATCLLLPAISLFVFVSSQTGFSHHLRYVLPSMIFFAVSVGVLASPGRAFRRSVPTGAFLLALCGATATVANLPHSHAYFNSFVGGPRNGPKHLLNSNIDWGQDILLLERWVRQNPDKPLDGIQYSLPEWLGVRELTELPRSRVPFYLPPEHRPTETSPPGGPEPGRFAVNVAAIYDEDSGFAYLRQLEPAEYVGHTILIFEVDRDQANRIRMQEGLPLLEDCGEDPDHSENAAE